MNAVEPQSPAHPVDARFELYVKLLLATLGALVLDLSGIVSLIAMQSNPNLLSSEPGPGPGLIEAGVAAFIVLSMAASYFLFKVHQQINLMEAYHGGDSHTHYE